MMGYPDICIRCCRNFGSNDCPTSSLCMATTDKPYFKPKKQEWMWSGKESQYVKKTDTISQTAFTTKRRNKRGSVDL